MRRYQVKAERKAWSDRGPDLLRTREGAVDATKELLKRGTDHVGRVLHANAGGSDWRELGSRRAALKWLDAALEVAHPGDRIVLGVRHWGEEVEVGAVVRTTEVEVEHLSGSTPQAELVNALYKTAFPTSLFAGAFVCKTIEGSNPPAYSDHAWGDAVDRTASKTSPNDAMSDWGSRMAATGSFGTFSYLLGSRDGDVVEASRRLFGSWRLKPSSASTSHLWHVHNSIRKHSGRPPCAG